MTKIGEKVRSCNRKEPQMTRLKGFSDKIERPQTKSKDCFYKFIRLLTILKDSKPSFLKIN